MSNKDTTLAPADSNRLFPNIRIVLINTFHPGNIGSVARAMKTMGLSELYLVAPKQFPAEEATTMAVGADDILASAKVVNTLHEAIDDCALVVGTSARSRANPWPVKTANEAAQQIVAESKTQQAAIVFGRETMGLHNDELQRCNVHVYIPSNPNYKALNLAAAVQIICYEIFLAGGTKSDYKQQVTEYSTKKDMDYFYEHLEQTLRDIGFIIKAHPGKTMLKLKRYFNRTRPELLELNMLRGILTAIQTAAHKKPKHDD